MSLATNNNYLTMLSINSTFSKKTAHITTGFYPGKGFTFLLFFFNTNLLYKLLIFTFVHIARIFGPAILAYLLFKYILKLFSSHFAKHRPSNINDYNTDSSNNANTGTKITKRQVRFQNELTIDIQLPPRRQPSASNPPSCPDSPTLPASGYSGSYNKAVLKTLDRLFTDDNRSLSALLEPCSRNALYIEQVQSDEDEDQNAIDQIIQLYCDLDEQDRDMINSSKRIPQSYYDFPEPPPLEIPEKFKTNCFTYLPLTPI